MTAFQPTINAAAPALPAGNRLQTAPEAAVSAKTWLAVAGATLGAFMAVLNIQIVNASLADIQGAIGAGIDDGGWISTSYLIAEIVVIPLSGWLAQVFSIRIYLLTNAVLFLAFSVACAFAQDLPQMIVLRALQGFSAGVLIPMAFTLIITLLPPDNATGNFTKIVQRVPVKIVLDDHSLNGLLRPGMSAEPTIDTKATVLAEREAKSLLASGAPMTRREGG